MKYKVGDKVKIRKDLKVGQMYGGCLFTEKMNNLVGETARITYIYRHNRKYQVASSHSFWADEMFEEDKKEMNNNDSIRILVSGNQVIAIHMETCKRGVARCHPDDAFDFFVGAKIALERLKEAEKPYGWLKEGVKYYTPAFGAYDEDDDLWLMSIYRGESIDKMNMKRGIAFKTREEAIACAKKMLAAVKQEG